MSDTAHQEPSQHNPALADLLAQRTAELRAENKRTAPSDPLRTTARGVGQLLLTLGVIVLLFVVYEVWVTNLFGAQQQAAATAELDQLWAEQNLVVDADPNVIVGDDMTAVVEAPAPILEPDQRERTYETSDGVGFAKMYIPTFGSDFMFTIVEGTRQVDLYAGPGHYRNSQYPGQVGNFAMAGHRVNKGAPFDDVDLLESCDAIVIETADFWYIYRVLPMADEVDNWDALGKSNCDGVAPLTDQYAGIYGQEITHPTDAPQIQPIPHVAGSTADEAGLALMTMTTCHPKFSDRQRMIIHSILVESYPKVDGFLPPQMQES